MCCLADRHVLPFAESYSRGRENQRVRVHIDPRQISLLPVSNPNGGGSGINGRIVAISGEKGKIRVAVDIGVDLQVLMEEQQFLSRPFQVLQQVRVSIPQQGVQILP